MDTPDYPSPSSSNEELRLKCASLQQQINILLFALLLVSATLAIYLYMQDRWTNRDLLAVKGPATQMVQNYVHKQQPQIDSLIEKLLEYGQTHPDFRPIIEKYHMSEVSTNQPQK